MAPNRRAMRTASSEADDRSLLNGIATKDEAAFERLYKRYYQRLNQFVIRLVRDRRLAEEVVDDTMYAVWKTAARFEGRSNVSTWIFGIAYRRALKTVDGNKRHTYFDHDSDRIDFVADDHADTNPETAITTEDLRRELNEAIDLLSDNHKAVMQLTIMGYNYDEISDIVECPPGTVKTRMFHARRKLKSIISEQSMLTMIDERQNISWPHRTQLS